MQILESIPGVGRRSAEVVVTFIDDPKRFKNARAVSAYAGMVPRQHQSGETDRMGKMDHRGVSFALRQKKGLYFQRGLQALSLM